MNGKSKRDPIPEDFGSIKAAAEFWETYSLADYWEQTRKVDFDVDLERRVVLVVFETTRNAPVVPSDVVGVVKEQVGGEWLNMTANLWD